LYQVVSHKKGDPRWDGQAVQSAGLFYICLNALPNPPPLPVDEEGKRPARALTALSLLFRLGFRP
jgi:hypothetical protein